MKSIVKTNTVSAIMAAMFTAMICVFSQIALPLPLGVPFTLQTFAIALCGYVLGVKYSLASVTAYILLGVVGVPVFSGFKGGVQMLFSVTGGFIYGFIIFTVLCGLSHQLNNKFYKIVIGLSGLLACHILGVIQFSVIYGTSFLNALVMVSLPYLPKDIVSVVAAYFLSEYIRKLMKKF